MTLDSYHKEIVPNSRHGKQYGVSGDRYEVFAYSPADDSIAQEIVSLLQTVFPMTFRNTKLFLWKHRDNPSGKSLITFARDTLTGEVVAARAFWRSDYVYGGHLIKGYQPCDTAVHPNHRRKRLFESTTILAKDLALQQGASLLINFPGSMSLPGYKKLGWSVSNQLVSFVRPGSFSALFKKTFSLGIKPYVASRFVTDPQPGCPDHHDWNQWSPWCADPHKGAQVFLPANRPDIKRWRYDLKPNSEYQIAFSNELAVIFRVGFRSRLRELQIVDIGVAGKSMDTRLLRKVLEDVCRNERADVVTALISRWHPLFFYMIRLGFFPLRRNVSLAYSFIGDEYSLGNLSETARFGIMAGDIDTF